MCLRVCAGSMGQRMVIGLAVYTYMAILTQSHESAHRSSAAIIAFGIIMRWLPWKTGSGLVNKTNLNTYLCTASLCLFLCTLLGLSQLRGRRHTRLPWPFSPLQVQSYAVCRYYRHRIHNLRVYIEFYVRCIMACLHVLYTSHLAVSKSQMTIFDYNVMGGKSRH